MFEHEYKKMTKNPLHLLLEGAKFTFSSPEEQRRIEKKVDELWKEAPNNDIDQSRYTVKETFTIDGREVYIMQEIPFRFLYALGAYIRNKEDRKQLSPEMLNLSLANPLGKIQLASPLKKGFQTRSVIGRFAATGALTAIGGHLDREDFTESRLPNGESAIAPVKADGSLDMKKIQDICRAMDQAEQEMAPIDCPATRGVLREGTEETGVKCYTLTPIGKCERYLNTPLGERKVLEHWPVYNLYPMKESTIEQIQETFAKYQQDPNAEKELASLDIFFENNDNRLTSIFQYKQKRPSVEAVLGVEERFQKQRLETETPLFVSPFKPSKHPKRAEVQQILRENAGAFQRPNFLNSFAKGRSR